MIAMRSKALPFTKVVGESVGTSEARFCSHAAASPTAEKARNVVRWASMVRSYRGYLQNIDGGIWGLLYGSLATVRGCMLSFHSANTMVHVISGQHGNVFWRRRSPDAAGDCCHEHVWQPGGVIGQALGGTGAARGRKLAAAQPRRLPALLGHRAGSIGQYQAWGDPLDLLGHAPSPASLPLLSHPCVHAPLKAHHNSTMRLYPCMPPFAVEPFIFHEPPSCLSRPLVCCHFERRSCSALLNTLFY